VDASPWSPRYSEMPAWTVASPWPSGGTSAFVQRERTDETAADRAMERYSRGDDAAFADVYDAVAPRLYAYLVRQARDAAKAEDLVQQTLLQMHHARARFTPGAAVLPWAFAIARRLFIDGTRRGRREVLRAEEEERDEAAAEAPGADELLSAQELAAKIDRTLAKLPESQRVAFELIKRDGLSLAEAAEALGTTVTAVKLRAHRAYEALRAALGDVDAALEKEGRR
jgi:RNA polymerase sigma-70 factor (ECF subfamily)